MLCVMLPIVLYRPTIRRPPGINSNHPQPTSNIGQKEFPVLKPFKEQLSRRRVTPPPPRGSKPRTLLRSDACLGLAVPKCPTADCPRGTKNQGFYTPPTTTEPPLTFCRSSRERTLLRCRRPKGPPCHPVGAYPRIQSDPC